MKTRQLGGQGLEVSMIGLGCMGMSEFYGSYNEQASFKTLATAIDTGVHFWDTSDIYGPKTNEILLGKYFSKNPGHREKISLATKFGIMRNNQGDFLGFNGRPEYVKQACDASLQRLGVDHIDLYYQHRMDPNVPIEDTVGAMSDLVTAGKIRYLGLSEAGTETLKRASAVHPISALQSEYSLWSRDLESQILPLCKKLEIGLVAYSPLGRGFLTGAIQSRQDLELGDWRLNNPRFSEEHFAKNLKLVRLIKDLASIKNCTPAQLALAWIAHQSQDYISIPGTRNELRLRENAMAENIKLTSLELTQIAGTLSSLEVYGSRYPENMMTALEV
ncbi:aldo/keto reductase [Pseudoalteromonas denitrificans]|uniref:Predicted oxidoreductase n=1 Tax=Pseudoalteromonas denitrificans DSM 6059 TaxID=1123010 RepID=A0A1I1I453_9GAMM|nr:aldo/keto reductase [Pseudoalteromonas denitrificans]SFC31077.1 Predicted oxidoreductase [Pseudoalteromonas denitrificans DSM 6059]